MFKCRLTSLLAGAAHKRKTLHDRHVVMNTLQPSALRVSLLTLQDYVLVVHTSGNAAAYSWSPAPDTHNAIIIDSDANLLNSGISSPKSGAKLPFTLQAKQRGALPGGSDVASLARLTASSTAAAEIVYTGVATDLETYIAVRSTNLARRGQEH
jgi:hypothetical protein